MPCTFHRIDALEIQQHQPQNIHHSSFIVPFFENDDAAAVAADTIITSGGAHLNHFRHQN